MKKCYVILFMLFLFLHINVLADEPAIKIQIYNPFNETIESKVQVNNENANSINNNTRYLKVEDNLTKYYNSIKNLLTFISMILIAIFLCKIYFDRRIIQSTILCLLLCFLNIIFLNKFEIFKAILIKSNITKCLVMTGIVKYAVLSLVVLFVFVLILSIFKTLVYKESKNFVLSTYIIVVVGFLSIVLATSNSIL